MEIFSRLNHLQKLTRSFALKIRNYERLKTTSKVNLLKLDRYLKAVYKEIEQVFYPDLKNILSEWYEREFLELKERFLSQKERLGQDLKQELQKANLSFSGLFPFLKLGLYTLEVNFELGFCNLYWGNKIELLKSKIPLEAKIILKTIQDFNFYLTRHQFNAQEFLQKLFTAYNRYLYFHSLPFGEKIFLVDLLNELVALLQPKEFYLNPTRKNFFEYPRIRFSYDLYRLKAAKATQLPNAVLKLYVATFDATLEKKKSLWVPNNEFGEGTYYSYISFNKLDE